MHPQLKGLIQFILVVGFLVGAFTTSAILSKLSKNNGSGRPGPPIKQEKNQILQVDSITLASSSKRITFSATGTVRIRNAVNITPLVSGRIIQVDKNFYEGGSFTKNKVLFQIDPKEYALEVDRLKAEVAAAKTNLELEKAEAETAKIEWNELNPNRKIPDLVARKPQLQQSQAELDAAYAQLARAKLDLERTRYSFPFAGNVLESLLEIGQYVSAGQDYGDVYAKDNIEIIVPLDSEKIAWLQKTPQPEITITSSFLGEKNTYSATLDRISAELNDSTRFANAILKINDAKHHLVPNVFIEVSFASDLIDNIWLIPRNALLEDNSVWVIDSSGIVTKQTLNIIYQNPNQSWVRGNNSTIEIAVNNLLALAEGMQVKTSLSKGQDNEQ